MLGKFISREKYESMVAVAAEKQARLLDLDQQNFLRDYNKNAFSFEHNLTEHPYFSLEALVALCKRMPDDKVKFRYGEVPNNAEFDNSLKDYQGDLTLEEALGQLVEKRTYIAIYNPELDPDYCALIEEILGEIAFRTREIDPYINWYSTYIFISSMGSVTPYHMDREMNFLMQIRGSKTAKLWERSNDLVMTSLERDTLLTDRGKARPTYSEAIEKLAIVFDLEPGIGVHHPFIAPHLISTDTDVSISLAVTYRTELSDIWTDAHGFNYWIRKLAVAPLAVGIDFRTDRRKAKAFRALTILRRCIGRLLHFLRIR